MKEFVTTAEAAEMIGIKKQSLLVRSVRGRPPFPVNPGRKGATQNLYLADDIWKFIIDRQKKA